MITKAKVRSDIIEHTVIAFFKEHAWEVYERKETATTAKVLEAVQNVLHSYDFRWTDAVKGEVFDCIRLLGPECGKEDLWLALYGRGVLIHQPVEQNEWELVDEQAV